MKTTKVILFIIGVVLLSVNILGIFKTMRNPELYDLEKTFRNRVNDVTIKYPAILDSLERKENESNVEYAIRANSLIHDGYTHYWKRQGIDKFHMRVPVWENYMLYIASVINPKKYERYDFSNYKKNLERGVGVCSSHCIVLKGVLGEQGIKSELMDIGGHHVVLRAELNDTTTYILDPDYGIVVPHDTAAIQANPELSREPYSRMADLYYPDAIDPYTTDYVVKLYGSYKKIYNVHNEFEYFSYKVIWILPLLLMLPWLISLIVHKSRGVMLS